MIHPRAPATTGATTKQTRVAAGKDKIDDIFEQGSKIDPRKDGTNPATIGELYAFAKTLTDPARGYAALTAAQGHPVIGPAIQTMMMAVQKALPQLDTPKDQLAYFTGLEATLKSACESVDGTREDVSSIINRAKSAPGGSVVAASCATADDLRLLFSLIRIQNVVVKASGIAG